MDPDTLFGYSGPIAMTGWLILAFSPLAPRLAQLASATLIPLLLSIAYTVLILTSWSDAPGGFDSLSNVMLLFTVPSVALAGWLHYLAFDLFVGAWIVRTARAEDVAHWQVLPCLVLAFLFGPVGFALFFAIRITNHVTSNQPMEA